MIIKCLGKCANSFTPHAVAHEYPDDEVAGIQLTRWLIARGRRRIAYVNFSHGSAQRELAHYSAEARQSGYQRAMAESGLEPRFIVAPQRVDFADRPRLALTCLAGVDSPDAVITYGTIDAGAVITAALRLGLRIHEDVTVATFGDTPTWCGGIAVPTIVVPQRQIGALAVDLLLRRIAARGRSLPSKVVPFAGIVADG